MLIGDDLPWFIAARIMPPASKANSRSAEPAGRDANPARSRCNPLLRPSAPLLGELDLDPPRHLPGVRGCRRRQVGDHTDLGDDQLQVAPSTSLTYASTCSILFSVTSMRVPLGALA